MATGRRGHRGRCKPRKQAGATLTPVFPQDAPQSTEGAFLSVCAVMGAGAGEGDTRSSRDPGMCDLSRIGDVGPDAHETLLASVTVTIYGPTD
ncbi:hypothetical protein [Acidithiobacillus sp.]|uniref:hypothetical protein n=1 Tax=Acidithiobacillus sp. TaxID=1872118 RepID=UPI002639134C|nr:hypothetical protein [Acidithiobacillus sp.]